MKTKYPVFPYLKALIAFVVINLLILNSWGQVSMTVGNSATQNFVSLSSSGGSWTDNSTVNNWYWQESGSMTPIYIGDNGSTNPAITTCYAYYGTSMSGPDIAIGGVSFGGGSIAMGIQLKNNSGAPIDNIKVSYTGEQWHYGGDKTAAKITFWYKISSSVITDLTPGNNTGWTALTSLDFTSPVLMGMGSGQLDGNASANRTVFSNISIPNISVPSGSYIMLRWSYPTQGGARHGLAIDDVNITWIGNTVSVKNANWNAKTTWNNGLPNATTNAIINNSIIGNSNAACYNLIINSAKNLTINAGKVITVNNNFLIKSSSSGVGSFINNGTLNISGSPSVEMYVPGTTIHNGIYFSPPLSSIMAPTVSDLVYRYNAPTCEWILVYDQLNIGTGYTVRSDNPTTINLNGGSLYNSNLSIGGLVRQATPNNYGWNLVGNPYVCGMDWDILNNTASNFTNLTDGFYIRASDGSTISWVNGVGTPVGTSSIIPPIHGFYAQVLLGQTSGSLTIPLIARTHNTSNFYKNVLPIIRMQITSHDGYSDETVFRIDNNATEKLDNEFDGTKMFADNDNIPQIFSLTPENDELCINAISVAENKIVTIPIGFKSNVAGEYTFKAFDFINVDNSISFFIKDNQTNILQDLRKNPIYVFNTSSTFDTERFVLIISKQPAGINNDNTSSKVYISSVDKSIIIDLQGQTNGRVEVYNVLGEQIINKQLNSTTIQKIDLSVNEGIYIVKVFTSTSTTAKKVVIK